MLLYNRKRVCDRCKCEVREPLFIDLGGRRLDFCDDGCMAAHARLAPGLTLKLSIDLAVQAERVRLSLVHVATSDDPRRFEVAAHMRAGSSLDEIQRALGEPVRKC